MTTQKVLKQVSTMLIQALPMRQLAATSALVILEIQALTPPVLLAGLDCPALRSMVQQLL